MAGQDSSTGQDALRCCIAGGGPAGMMLGFLLARAGVAVTVLEKHADFLRDFRGDTVHPSTLQVLDQTGLLAEFDSLPQRRVERLGVRISGRFQPVIEFRGLKPFGYLSFVPQWDFLELLAAAGRRCPSFDLRMRHEAIGLLREGERVTGLEVRTPDGVRSVYADLVVGCDGRHSTLRAASALRPTELGAPMDVLWFRLPRSGSDPEDTFAMFGRGQIMVLLNRTSYWQAAYVVPKGSDRELRAGPIADLRAGVAEVAPFLSETVTTLTSWEDVKTLEVRVDRLERWYLPGLLLIGDAAHAMSPIGGVGINLAIQDAVAAANELIPVLVGRGPVGESPLLAVQRRRLGPTRWTQALQLQAQKWIISRALEPDAPPLRVPALLRWLLGFDAVRRVPARLVGYGFRREEVLEF